MINISLFRDDWIETALTGLRRERTFCNNADSEILKLIIGRREEDLRMYNSLFEKEREDKMALQNLIIEEKKMIEEIKQLLRRHSSSTEVPPRRTSARRNGNM